MTIKDNAERYGLFSRILHWGMALLFLWQFMSALSHYFLEDTVIEAFFWPSHKPLGVLLLLLMVIRLVWAMINASGKPRPMNVWAKLGHWLMYLVMILIPVLALLRQYGSGRAFEPFGIPVFAGFEDEKISWMMDAGSNFHGELGWILLLLIIGHIVMTIKHQKNNKDVISRMW